jgi:hypothetical protein
VPRGVYQRPEPAPATFGALVAQARAVGEARRAKAAGVEGGGASLRGALLTLAEVADGLADRGA